ncbi:cytochrome P450 [Usnea florida]
MALITVPALAVIVACCSTIYYLAIGVYRLYFSPIAKFPGPKLAALTLWVEFYYDVVKRGRYTWKIEEMHKRYGPIIRINPYELHIDDPEYYDELYAVGSARRIQKYEWAMKGFGPTWSTFATESHELHRTRRGALAPFFSKASVYQLEPTVQTIVEKLESRLNAIRGSGTVINLVDVFVSLTADIIVQYAFAKPYNLIDSPDFAPFWHKGMMDGSEASHTFKQFGWLEPMVRRIPQGFVTMMSPQLGALLSVGKLARAQIIDAKAELAEGNKPQGQKTVFYELLTNDQLQEEDKTVDRLEAEGISVFGAGSMTVANALCIITFHVISDADIMTKLQTELKTVKPRLDSRPKWNQLEHLPYLTAVILEGLRWGYGVPQRLQRISPDVALQYKEWTIPKGTPVGMDAFHTHNNPHLFPHPRLFSPDRWLQPSSTDLRKYLVAFGKGSRQCLGMNLAYCELYLTLFALFKPAGVGSRLELWETGVGDVEIEHDFFNAAYRVDSRGVRVRVL